MAEEQDDQLLVSCSVYDGPVDELLARMRRRQIDPSSVPVAEITAQLRRRLGANPPLELIARIIDVCARMVQVKAGSVDSERVAEDADEDVVATAEEARRAGARLAEYRLFRAAAEQFLAEIVEAGPQSFPSIVIPEILPQAKLALPADRLASAFKAAVAGMERKAIHRRTLAENYSIDEKIDDIIRAVVGQKGVANAIAILARGRSRVEAAVLFLGLLELLRRGWIAVEQPSPTAAITIAWTGPDEAAAGALAATDVAGASPPVGDPNTADAEVVTGPA